MHTRLFFHSAAGPARHGRLFLGGVMAVAITAVFIMTAPLMAEELEWIYETTSSLEVTNPPLPSYEVHLILDDDTHTQELIVVEPHVASSAFPLVP